MHLLFLFALLAVSVAVDLLHQEGTSDFCFSCPACTFQISSVAEALVPDSPLPAPALVGKVEISIARETECPPAACISARSPPAA